MTNSNQITLSESNGNGNYILNNYIYNYFVTFYIEKRSSRFNAVL